MVEFHTVRFGVTTSDVENKYTHNSVLFFCILGFSVFFYCPLFLLHMKSLFFPIPSANCSSPPPSSSMVSVASLTFSCSSPRQLWISLIIFPICLPSHIFSRLLACYLPFVLVTELRQFLILCNFFCLSNFYFVPSTSVYYLSICLAHLFRWRISFSLLGVPPLSPFCH